MLTANAPDFEKLEANKSQKDLLRVEDLHVDIKLQRGSINVLKGVNFRIPRAKTVALVGVWFRQNDRRKMYFGYSSQCGKNYPRSYSFQQ